MESVKKEQKRMNELDGGIGCKVIIQKSRREVSLVEQYNCEYLAYFLPKTSYCCTIKQSLVSMNSNGPSLRACNLLCANGL